MQLWRHLCVVNDDMPFDFVEGQSGLTPDQIRGVAPDYLTLRVADDLVREKQWGVAGRAGDLCWVVYPEARRADIHTVFSLANWQAACSCGAARFPCRHILALLLRLHQEPFAVTSRPDWVADLLAQRVLPDQPEEVADNEIRAATLRGLADLERRLGDLMRQGLAGFQTRSRSFWPEAANRTADAYLPEIAHQLRELALIPVDSPSWAEQILPRLGRLALIIEGFKHHDQLTPPMRGDLLAAVGISPPITADQIPDRWIVTGRHQAVSERQRIVSTWLFGDSSRRWALLIERMPARTHYGTCYPVGSKWAGTLAFRAGSQPLQAVILDALVPANDFPNPALPATDIEAAVEDYAAALALNPFWQRHPFLLAEVWVEPVRGNWRLRDSTGALLPLADRFGQGWQLLSISAGRPFSLFGEWDGHTFSPMSLFNGQWHNLSSWRGLP